LLRRSEFAAEFPLAGGAYNYISMSLGELPAWLVVTTLIMEYILAAAAVSRAFSACELAAYVVDMRFFASRSCCCFVVSTLLLLLLLLLVVVVVSAVG
jgi:amino acid transporter